MTIPQPESNPVRLGADHTWILSPGQDNEDVYSRIHPMLPPYEHQRRAVNEAYADLSNHGFHALFMEMGTGKTKTTIDAWMVCCKESMYDALLIVAPKTLLSTWSDEEVPKHASIPYDMLVWDNKSSPKSNAAFDSLLASKRPIIYVINVEAFQSLNETARTRISKILRGRKTLMAVDECFTPDTLVDLIIDDGSLTPCIKRTMIKDVKIGDTVVNAMGRGTVYSTAKREVFGAVNIEYKGERVTCSQNHLFLTNHGWVQARYVLPGDLLASPEASMRLVRSSIYSKKQDKEWSCPKVLRAIMLSEMEDEAERCKRQNIHKRNCGKDKENERRFLQESSRERQGETRSHRSDKSDVKSRVESEMLANSTGHEASTESSRRQRVWNDCASVNVIQASWERLGCRVRNSYENAKRFWLPALLQSGLGECCNENSYRNRWEQSLFKARSGQEEGCVSDFIRVDSVEVLEQADSRLDEFRDAEGRLYFYDLGVSGHPSFCVNGVVVHNSSYIKGPDAKRSKNVVAAGRLARGKLILTGTEISKSPLDLYMQFEFLHPGIWGCKSYFMFRSRYAVLVDSYGAGGRSFKKVVGYQKLNEMMDIVTPFITRAMKKECLDMPDKVRVKIKVSLTPTQNGMYQQLKRDLATLLATGELMTLPNKISLFTKFRQLVGGTMKFEGEYKVIEPRPEKLVALIDDLEDTDEQAIIWCAFRGEIQLVAKALAKLGTVVTFDGSTDIDDRSKARLDFQSGKARFFVANMKAGSFGLNLQNCHLQYFYSRDLSPQVNWQAEDRSHRPGQKETCVYKSLIVRDTVDERILQLIEESADLRDLLRGMGAKDIMELL